METSHNNPPVMLPSRDVADLENEIYKRRSDLGLLEQQQREEEEVWKSVEPGQAQSQFGPMWTPNLSFDPEVTDCEKL